MIFNDAELPLLCAICATAVGSSAVSSIWLSAEEFDRNCRSPCLLGSPGGVAALVLLVFCFLHAVDHSILCRRLELSFGLRGPVLACFQSYLHGRSEYVQLVCGVHPHGSVLGPILFIMYTALIEHNSTRMIRKYRPQAPDDHQPCGDVRQRPVVFN